MLINCRQATRLISQRMDAKLPWHRRLAVRIHLLYCLWCRRYAVQVRTLRAATQQLDPEAPISSQRLSAEAKTQMRARLQEAARLPPEPPR